MEGGLAVVGGGGMHRCPCIQEVCCVQGKGAKHERLRQQKERG